MRRGCGINSYESTPLRMFSQLRLLLLRWVPVARTGPTTLLAPMYLTKGRNYKVKLWTTWVTSAVFMLELWMAGHSRPAMNNLLEFPWASGIAHKMLINQHDSSEGSFPILEINNVHLLFSSPSDFCPSIYLVGKTWTNNLANPISSYFPRTNFWLYWFLSVLCF